MCAKQALYSNLWEFFFLLEILQIKEGWAPIFRVTPLYFMSADECFKNTFWSWGAHLMKRSTMSYITPKEEENGTCHISVKFKHLKRFQKQGWVSRGSSFGMVIYQPQLGRDKAGQDLHAGAAFFTTCGCVINLVECDHLSVHLICLCGHLSPLNNRERL